jgi:hypothetical protein
MTLFLKAIGGGVLAVICSWVAVLVVNQLRVDAYNKRTGMTGLGATAGGWNYLLQLPSVCLVLTIAFGVGLYLTVRLATRS